ncbi:MAG TPA: transglycosylase SLT domain-containing protein [Candidatus Acidoferrales bacterium]|nr:transglycosylase SLT domain-containing protein [Candidatus Acidoferrales bacterium]
MRRVAVTLALAIPLMTAEAAVFAGTRSEFDCPAALRSQVEFWKQIFTTRSKGEVLIHDTWHLDRIYSVLDFSALADGAMSDAELSDYVNDRTRVEKERVRSILLKLNRGADEADLSAEEKRIRGLFRDDPSPTRFLDAAADDRIRGQRGLRERFSEGIEVSRRYLPEMEAIFRHEGLPVELTRLPLVESCFDVHAYSKVGAAGIWQFMPSAGRPYMRIDSHIDERRDPIASTHAAAALLRRNYEVLGAWPVAITAYNHGRAGMARAVDEVGTTDIVEIIRSYHGPLFKFASRNFYAEFLAALEVERDAERYFGKLRSLPPQRCEQVLVPDSTSLGMLAHAAGCDTDSLVELNPAFTPAVVRGNLYVPKGWRLRVPLGAQKDFHARYASLAARSNPAPAKREAKTRNARYVTHRVQRGQTLAGIARKYNTTVDAIQKRNRLRDGQAVRAGQSLIIPRG